MPAPRMTVPNGVKVKKPKTRKFCALQRGVGHEIRRRADQREHAADQPCET